MDRPRPRELSHSMIGSQPSLCLALSPAFQVSPGGGPGLCLSASLDLHPSFPGWPALILYPGVVQAISALLGGPGLVPWPLSMPILLALLPKMAASA